jgi:pyruvate dehydrogenase complex dihydrolipoamide acetyltransferase long form
VIEITMPRLSDTMEEGAIATWHKHPGDAVAVGDVLVEIETDKATMEYEAYEAGTLAQILVPEGETVAIGAPIALLDDGAGGDGTRGAASPEPLAAESSRVAAPDAPATAAAATSTAAAADAVRRVASPLVRRLAREHRLDLSTVSGSGPGGRIIRNDIDHLLGEPESVSPAEASTPATAALQAPAPAESTSLDDKRGSREVAFSNARRVIARRLGESARTIPHYFVTAVADAEVLMQLRADLNARPEPDGGDKVSVNDLLIRACALALREHPLVNASIVSETSPTMLVHDRVNIGVAVATEKGLVVPVIVDADTKTVGQLGRESRELAALANGKGLTIDQMSGGTFTISNLGMFGVEQFTAIINPPQSAILAVGAARREAVVHGETLVARYQLRYTMSADHRVIDGALAAAFLRTLTSLVENPWRIIA